MSLLIPIVAVLPGLLLLVYFNARQEYHLSADIVWSSVLLGAAVSLLAVGVELGLDIVIQPIADPYDRAFARAFLGTSLPEEVCKFIIVFWIAMRSEDYERPVDALVLSVAVALGFATFENLLYLIQSDDWGRTATARAMTAVPSHVINAMLMGYFLGLAHLQPRRAPLFWLLAIFAPTINHGAYDLPLFLLDELNRSAGQATAGAGLPLVISFAGVIGAGSLAALACWYDLLQRDAADAAGRELPYIIERLPERIQRWESLFWLLVGCLLTAGSLGLGLSGFIAPSAEGRSWAALYPKYFMLASSILPCLFGFAMFGHGAKLLINRPTGA
jgi:hypothetical protein